MKEEKKKPMTIAMPIIYWAAAIFNELTVEDVDRICDCILDQ